MCYVQRTIAFFLISCSIFFFSMDALSAWTLGEKYHHIVVLGDPHLPGKHFKAKEHVIQDINSWADVEMVVVEGDICDRNGNDKEYEVAKQFFDQLDKPFCPIVGNHDFYYADTFDLKGRIKKGTLSSMRAKLSKFRQIFGLSNICYIKKIGGYLLIFLSPESPNHPVELSEYQLVWLQDKLEKNSQIPTMIFFHAPLKGTLRNYNKHVNSANFIAQPFDKLHDILIHNPQVFLWISGHTHTSPKEESFASDINLYENHITNIHNTDMNRKTIWSNSLYLYPDKVVIRTYNHNKSIWLANLERTIQLPKLNYLNISKSLNN